MADDTKPLAATFDKRTSMKKITLDVCWYCRYLVTGNHYFVWPIIWRIYRARPYVTSRLYNVSSKYTRTVFSTDAIDNLHRAVVQFIGSLQNKYINLKLYYTQMCVRETFAPSPSHNKKSGFGSSTLSLMSNSWTYNFVKFSRHNHECSQTWGFRLQCLHYKPVLNLFRSRGRGGSKIFF